MKMIAAASFSALAIAYMLLHPDPASVDQQVIGFLVGVSATLAALGAPAYWRMTERWHREAKQMERELRLMKGAALTTSTKDA